MEKIRLHQLVNPVGIHVQNTLRKIKQRKS